MCLWRSIVGTPSTVQARSKVGLDCCCCRVNGQMGKENLQ